jgi:hypothetical protein
MQLNVAGFSLINGQWVPEEDGEDDRAVKGGEMAQVPSLSNATQPQTSNNIVAACQIRFSFGGRWRRGHPVATVLSDDS